MGSAFQKVRPGEPLRVSAAAWNALVSEVETKPRFIGEQADASPLNFRIRVRNDTATGVGQWAILHVTGIAVTPSTATGATGNGYLQYSRWPSVVGVEPTDATAGNYCVTVEPIKAGEFGLAAIDGVVQAKIDVVSEGDIYASPKAGVTTELKSGSNGSATILWKESGTGTGKLAIVRIGSAAGGGVRLGKITGTITKGSAGTIYEYDGSGVQLSQPTGSSGATAPVSFTGVNRFATVTAGTGAAKWVACGLVGSAWHLIAAECG